MDGPRLNPMHNDRFRRFSNEINRLSSLTHLQNLITIPLILTSLAANGLYLRVKLTLNALSYALACAVCSLILEQPELER